VDANACLAYADHEDARSSTNMSIQKNWFLAALLSGVAAMALLVVVSYLPTLFAVVVLLVGVAVFLIVLYFNPAGRYFRMATTLASSWLTMRGVPQVQELSWVDGTFGYVFVQRVGSVFDVTIGGLIALLLLLDLINDSPKGVLRSCFRNIRIILGRQDQSASVGHNRQVQIRDVSAPGTNVMINQSQGLSGPDVIELVKATQQKVPVHLSTTNASTDIDLAAEQTKAGQPDIAIHLLTELRKRSWDQLSSRDRYRVEANLGRAQEKKGQVEEAARQYLKAKAHQPQDEEARSLEAMAFHLLGNRDEAFRLANAVLADYRYSMLAIAVAVRSAPSSMSFSEVERAVPAAARNAIDVLHALAWRAAEGGDFVTAEKIARQILALRPDLAEAKEQLGTILVQSVTRAAALDANKARNPEQDQRAKEAVSLLTDALAVARGKKEIAQLRYIRAAAFEHLGDSDQAETDFRVARDNDPGDPEFARLSAVHLVRRGQRNAAIDVLGASARDGRAPVNSLILAQLLGERNGSNDRLAATEILRKALPNATKAEPDFRTELVATLSQLLSTTGQHEQATDLLERLDPSYLTKAALLAIRADVHRRANQMSEATKLAKDARALIDSNTSEQDRIRVALVLTMVRQFEDALGVWKQVLKPSHRIEDIHAALDCAKRCNDDQFILAFCKSVRENGIHDDACFELEVVTLERYNSLDDAMQLLAEHIKACGDDAFVRSLRVRLALIALKRKRIEFVEFDPARLPQVESVNVQLGGAVVYVLRHGPNRMDAARYAYELLRRHFGHIEAHAIYVFAMGLGDKESIEFEKADTVTPGTAVRYEEEGSGDQKWMVVEDCSSPDASRGEYGPEHPIARQLLGKRVGERFSLRIDPLQPRTGVIREIVSKYVYRKSDVMQRGEERFGDAFFAKAYNLPQTSTGEPDLSLIFRSVDRRVEHIEALHKLYRENPLSVTSFARMAQRSVFESLQHLAGVTTLPIRCCWGGADEIGAAEEALNSVQELVLDPMALATLGLSGIYARIVKGPFRFVVCEGAVQQLQEMLEGPGYSSEGFVTRQGAKYVFVEASQEDRNRFRDGLSSFLQWIRSTGTVETGAVLADLEHKEREQLIDLFGQATAESIARARIEGAALWTDDLIVAEIAKSEFRVKRVWTQLVVSHLMCAKLIVEDVLTDVTLFLLNWNYSFTRVLPESITGACRAAKWEPTRTPLVGVIRWFRNPETEAAGLLGLTASTFVRIWQEASLYHQKDAVTAAICAAVLDRPDGKSLLQVLVQLVDQMFGLDAVSAEGCKGTIARILRSNGGPRLILPGDP
jgi:tetratricopeptide (TPR) repeat protein